MTNENKTDIKVGLTVIISIAVLIFGIAYFKEWTISTHEEIRQAVFPESGGLQKGDPVFVNGIKDGTVKNIQPKQNSVIVTLAFTEPVDLRKDASASISMLEVMSGKKVEIKPGASNDPLPADALIRGSYSGDIGTLVAMVTSLSGALESITGKADTLLAGLNGMLQGDTLKRKIDRTLDIADVTLGNVSDLSRHASTFMSEEGPTLTKTISQADSTLHAISSVLEENRAGIRVLVDSGGMALGDARKLLGKLDTFIANASHENTLLYRLTRDTAFANRMDSTLTSLTKFIEQLRKQGLDANIRFFESSTPTK